MMHMTSLQMLCRVEAKDGLVDVIGCIRPFYLNFVVFYVLDSRAILVFCLSL
jgi:hypothetical protein